MTVCDIILKNNIDPAEIINISNETLKLLPELPQEWRSGTCLRHLQTLEPGSGTPAVGAIIPQSLVVKFQNKVLKQDEDYQIDMRWGKLGLGTKASLTENDEVFVDYSFSLLRIDSLVSEPDGSQKIVKGKSHLSIPRPPELKPNQKRIANIFVDYHSNGENIQIFPIIESFELAKTKTTHGLIPKTINKLLSGEEVKIICWGDSVTAGGDASSDETKYTSIFIQKLKNRFPKANIKLEVIAVPMSNSLEWLYPEKYTSINLGCNWQCVIDAQPDIITLEFVNDVGTMTEKKLFESTYTDILKRVHALRAELILITPHFIRSTERDKDNRSYVSYLKDFAAGNNIALADASARWEHLCKEGLPYITLLRNTFNHPDDRGHLIYAEELLKCFDF